MGRSNFFFFIFIIFLFSSCKKDLLYWQSVQKIESNSDTDRLGKIIFLDSKNGFIVGGDWYMEAVILSTRDGGNTWQKKAYPDVGQLLMSATVSPTGSIYSCGFEGKLMHTNDAGNTWQFHQLEHYWFRDMAFTDAGHAIVIGGISFNSGMMQHIDSSGNLLKRDSLNYQLNQITMVSGTVGYICGYGIVLKTTDGGLTWPVQNVLNDNFTAMDVHGEEIWMCGYNGGIYHTANGGNNWTRLRNGNDITLPSYHLNSILFKDSRNGWAAGDNGIVLYSDDGGNHWMEYSHFTGNNLLSITLSADGHLFVVGENGSIFKLTI